MRLPKLKILPGHTFGSGAVSVIYNAGFFLGGNTLNIVVRFCYALLLTRFLGPELYGYFSYGMSWYLTFLPLTGLGLDVILSRRIGKDRRDGRDAVSQTFTLRIVACIVTASACALAGYLTEAQPEMKKLLLIFSLALFGRSIAMWVDSVFAAYEKMKYALRLSMVCRPFEVAGGVIALLAGGGILTLALVQAISWWAQAVQGIVLLGRSGNKIRISREVKALKSILSRGFPIMIGGVLLSWMVQGPLIVYRRLSIDSDSLGQFALAVQLFLVLCHVPRSLNVAALPVLTRSVVRKDGKDIYYVSLLIRLAIICGTCLGLFCMDLGPWLVAVVFGDRFVSAAHLLALSVWLIVPWTCGNAILRLFFAQGKYYAQIVCAGIGSATLLISMPFLVDRFGASGAVMATWTGMVLWSLSMMGLLYRTGKLNTWEAVAKPLIAAGAGVGTYFCLIGIGPIVALLTSLAVLLGFVFLMDLFLPYERSILLKVVKSMAGRR